MKNKLFFPIAVLTLSLSACNSSKSETSTVKEVSQESDVQSQPINKAVQTVSNESIQQSFDTVPSYVKLTKSNIPVKGNADIEGFVYAIDAVINEYGYEENGSRFNKKAGYWEYFMEGDGMFKQQCCYWNRDDKKKLVAYFEHGHEYDINGNCNPSSFICFFLYNENTKELEPIKAPFSSPLEAAKNKKDHFVCNIPEKGKDIEYYIGCNGEENIVYKKLKWNGMGFDKE